MEDIKSDIAEVTKFEAQATRPKVLARLQGIKQEFETKLAQLEAAERTKSVKTGGDAISQTKPKLFTNTIKTYGWDQSEKFVKIYVSNLNGIQNLEKDKATITLLENRYRLFLEDLNGKNYELIIPKLFDEVSSATLKIKTDMVVVMLKKSSPGHWDALSVKEKEVKDKKSEKMKPPPMDSKDADPSKGIMDMMKKMYDDGDDDMKRTIAKAWTESREKQQGGGEGGMSGMPMMP